MSDITPVLDALGIDYVIHGDEASACCPHPDHRDSHPSWSVNLSTGMHHCFSCGFGGGFHSLVRALNGGTAQAARLWAVQLQLRAGAVRPPVPRTAPVDRAWRYGEAALAAMAEVPSESLALRHLTREAASLYQLRWNGSWVLPIRDAAGKLLGWQEKDGHRFCNRPRTVPKSEAVFGLWTLPRGGRAIIVESPLDAPRFLSAGIEGGLGTYGVNISAAQTRAIVNHAGAVMYALDNDDKGRAETRRQIARHPRITLFNYGEAEVKDPGEMSDEQVRWGVENALTPVAWLARQSARSLA